MTHPHQSDVIKNPNRRKQEVSQEDFAPAYMKKGIDPIPMDCPSIDGDVLSDGSSMPYKSRPKKADANPSTPQVGQFILMVFDKPILCGDHEDVVSTAKSILYGEHPQFLDTNICADDIVVLKRVAIRIGVFVDAQ